MKNPKAKKRKKKIIIAVVLLLIVGGVLAGMLRKKELPVTIQKEKAMRRNLTELVVANGKIQPVVQVKISPEVSGEIIALPIKEGQIVAKSNLLVSIRPDNYKATRDSSLANFKYSLANSNTAIANLEKANLEYQRNKALFNSKLISDSDFLTAKTTFDVAKASLDAAEEQVGMAWASLQSAESDLSKTKIYSPLDGTVSKLNSQLGERVVGTAMMAGTEIMTIADLNEMEARVDIGEVDVVLVSIGQKVHLEVDAFKDRKFNGIVTDIANSAKNNDTSTTASSSSTTQDATKFTVKIRLTEKEVFLPGMSVTAEIETRYRTNALTVPIQSVTTRLPADPSTNAAGTNAVLVAAATPASGASALKASEHRKPGEPAKPIEVIFAIEGDHVKMVPVKRGIADDNYVEITDGVAEGQEVVSGGSKAINRELQDGKKVVVGMEKTDLSGDKPKN